MIITQSLQPTVIQTKPTVIQAKPTVIQAKANGNKFENIKSTQILQDTKNQYFFHVKMLIYYILG